MSEIITPTKKQWDLIRCPANEILWGGAAGGGKSFGILLDWSEHHRTYGSAAQGLILRRTNPQLEEILRMAKMLFSKIPGSPTWNDKQRQFNYPDGAFLRLGYLDTYDDVFNYIGHSFCVAKGTGIRMGDGTLKPIQDITAGESVMTPFGPRKVLETHRIGPKPCVECHVWHGSTYLGHQIHPETHPILIAPQLPSASGFDTSFQSYEGCGFWRDYKSLLGDRLGNRDGASFGFCPDGSDTTTQAQLQGFSRPEQLCVPVVLHGPSALECASETHLAKRFRSAHRSSEWFDEQDQGTLLFYGGRRQLGEPFQSVQDYISSPHVAYATSYEQIDSEIASGSRAYCPTCHRWHDVPLRPSPSTVGEHLPSQHGAVSPIPTSWLPDGSVGTQAYIPQTVSRSAHPYSGAVGTHTECCCTGYAFMAPVGMVEVYDLTVEEHNQYVTSCGIVNKNTARYHDELTAWGTDEEYNLLNTRMRSTSGVKVRIVNTTNPGGPGHQWVMRRWKIDEHPGGYLPITTYSDVKGGKVLTDKEKDPAWDGMRDDELPDGIVRWVRMYIPARLEDNPHLDTDGQYRAQLMTKDKRLRAMLLEGRWDVVEGSFFSEWDPGVHVVQPFEIPKSWRRFVAMDWGTWSPYCVLWAAESPYGEVYIYRELYGMGEKPNQGVNEPPSVVGDKIVRIERMSEEYIHERYLDDSCWKGEKAGEITIASQFATSGVPFQPARRFNKVAAIGNLKEWLKVVNGKSRLSVFNTCRNLIRTLPIIPIDKNNPDQYDTKAEDHAVDALLYLMRRYMHDDGRKSGGSSAEDLNKRKIGVYSGMGVW